MWMARGWHADSALMVYADGTPMVRRWYANGTRMGCGCYADGTRMGLVQRTKVSVVPFQHWHYIHQTDLQYAGNFPLNGVLRKRADGSFEDVRRQLLFGEHAHIWVPQPAETDEYLTIVYGADWRTAMRARYG